MMRSTLVCCVVASAAISTSAQAARDVAPFVSVNAPVVVLNHVTVIDGTGAASREDQAVVIVNGKIQSIGPAASVQAPAGAQVLDRSGYTVIPGLVGMHDHLYYTDSYSVQLSEHGELGEPGLFVAEIPYTAPRLYLAAGVTTMRTTGSLEPYTDLKVKKRIDEGLMPGPEIDARVVEYARSKLDQRVGDGECTALAYIVGPFAQSFDADELDAAQLLMPIYGFLPATDERMRSTIDAIADELTEDGLVLRYRNAEGLNADGLTGEEGTFVICSFWLVSALAKAGEVDRAEQLFDQLASYANDLGLLAEEIDTANAELLGNFPQAFSHIGLITAAWEIDKARGRVS